jgi:hypothetical protein
MAANILRKPAIVAYAHHPNQPIESNGGMLICRNIPPLNGD